MCDDDDERMSDAEKMEKMRMKKMRDAEGPDRGYAWVITAAGFFVNFATFGFVRLAGVFYVSLRETFGDITREQAARPFSLSVTFHTLLGPVIGVLCRRLGNRPVALMGAVLTSSGVSLCYVAPNIDWISVFIGPVFGTGFGMIAISLQITINQYFQNMRVTASGLSFSGGCVSSFVLPALVELLTDAYGVHGTFLILGGLILNTLVSASLFRPPKWIAAVATDPRRCRKKDTRSVYSISKDTGATMLGDEKEDITCREILLPPPPPMDPSSTTTNNNNTTSSEDPPKVKTDGSRAAEESRSVYTITKGTEGEAHKKDVDCREILLPSSGKPGAEQFHAVCLDDRCCEQRPLPASPAKTKFVSVVRDILRHPIFYLIAVTVAMFFFVFFIFLTTIVDLAIDRGVPETSGKFVLSAYALGDLVGRLGLGWVTDRGFIKRRTFLMMDMVGIGAAILFLSTAATFTSLAVGAVCYGVVSGSIIVMFPVLVGDYFPMDHQSLALGGVYFFNGLLILAVPSTIGYFRDVEGSYVPLLYTLAALVVSASLLWSLEPWLLRKHEDWKKRANPSPNKA